MSGRGGDVADSTPSFQCDNGAEVEWVRNGDGSVLIDHRGRPLSVARMLATKPLRCELQTRPGPGGRKLTYVSGDCVTRSLNEVFGYDGWNLDIKQTKREDMRQDKDRFHVAYSALVRLTHRKSGTYKEEFGFGDSMDKTLATAIAHAVKASITDAMKRAARLFGDKLGNSLYASSFNVGKAPTTLEEALDLHEQTQTKIRFRTMPQIKQPIGLESVARAKDMAVQSAKLGCPLDPGIQGAAGPSETQQTYTWQKKDEKAKLVDLNSRVASKAAASLQTPNTGVRERQSNHITPAASAASLPRKPQPTPKPPMLSPVHQGRQSSSSFGLTKFVSNRDSFDGSFENRPIPNNAPLDQRPKTSSGPRQAFEMGPPSSGPPKRPLSHHQDEIHPPNKRINLNPYNT